MSGSRNFVSVLFSPQLTLQRIQRRSIIFRGRGVSNFFQGWGGGVQMLISIETHSPASSHICQALICQD